MTQPLVVIAIPSLSREKQPPEYTCEIATPWRESFKRASVYPRLAMTYGYYFFSSIVGLVLENSPSLLSLISPNNPDRRVKIH